MAGRTNHLYSQIIKHWWFFNDIFHNRPDHWWLLGIGEPQDMNVKPSTTRYAGQS